MEITLQEILDAREKRVMRQQALLAKHPKPLLCFTMNIPGPEKNNDLITKGFQLGKSMLHCQLRASGIPLLWEEEHIAPTGCEGFFVVDADPSVLKTLAVQIEDASPVGRLFDMDVLTPDGKKISRESLGLPGRTCLICGGPVHICSRSRAHSVEILQAKTVELLQTALWEQEAERIGTLAAKSLLYEVCTTPKPGLVDKNNTGSHRDMDLFTFLGSCAALQPYFTKCALIGLQTAKEPPSVTFAAIRFQGRQTEQTMYSVTGGVNTHKGAIFTLGLLCAATGRCASSCAEDICAQVSAMTQGLSAADFAQCSGKTTGEKLFARYGITGIRGQAEAGFPVLLQIGLPVLEEGLSQGLSLEESGCAALLHLMCAITDTNLIARSDLDTQKAVCDQVRILLEASAFPSKEQLEELDVLFTQRNLSPGGSADLLAATYFLYFLKQ